MSERTFYINYFDVIDENRTKALMALCAELMQTQRPEAFYFLFASPGGSVNAGIALYNFLKALPCKIVMHNTSTIDSIATVVFLSGEERYAAPHSSFLYHGVRTNFHQGASISLGQMRELETRLKHDEDKIAGIVSDHTKITEADMRKLFSEGESKDLLFAKEKGIIHEVRPVLIPQGSPLISLNFK